ncbi:hypothetical protein [uncultured Shimia sp.]|uniref:hypothetical protein n=1 Tax=uncultured Shimia sp. TaxID=573152 RepID=UPI0026259E1D|nr:hypothetical protein [uncultured Shimia sp.]
MTHRFFQPLFVAFFCITALVFAPSAQAEGLGEIGIVEYQSENGTPKQVGVGITIDQITFVDQQAENFGVVGTLFLQLNFPELAERNVTQGAPLRTYSVESFRELLDEVGAQPPFFIIRNQQGRRFTQQTTIIVTETGQVSYAERFTTTLQAPHFDFARYPFDTQTFFVEISSLLPTEFVEFHPLEDETGMGDTLGEEEWILQNPTIFSTTVEGIGGHETSMVALQFEAKRHVLYYILRILLPLIIILFVSWATFFLEEYRRRIDMASANLLVFVAFNFAISTTLPRLGYLTFMDSLFVAMFVITGSTVLVNIALRRLKTSGKEVLARKVDRYLVIWIYPLLHAGFLLWAVRFFLV